MFLEYIALQFQFHQSRHTMEEVHQINRLLMPSTPIDVKMRHAG
jgi:hypothetical protein